MRIIDKLAWITIRDRSVLFARTRGQTLFYTIGGKRQGQETDIEALLREVMEETGLKLIPDTIRYMHSFEGPAHNAPEGTKLKMACYEGAAHAEPKPESEIEELAWLTTKDLSRTTDMGATILKWLASKNLID